VLTDGHREALSNLEYAIAGRKGITVLIGEAGSGKTTLIRTAIARQPERVHCVHVQNPALTREEFVETLAERFTLSQLARTSKAALLSELELLLRRRAQAGETTVLIVDEAQSLPIDLLEELRLLVNVETNDRKLLSMILAGQPELALRLNEEGLRQLKQRVELRCELRPLTVLETMAYVAGRIRVSGGQGARVFTREAVMLIHESARGIPRTVNVLADNALLSGFALQHRPVTRQLVAEVCRDFDLRVGAVEPPAAMTELPPVRSVESPATAKVLTLDSPHPVAAPEEEPVSATHDSPQMFATSTKKRWRFFS